MASDVKVSINGLTIMQESKLQKKHGIIKSFVKQFSKDTFQDTLKAFSMVIITLTFNMSMVQTINFFLPQDNYSRIICYWILFLVILCLNLLLMWCINVFSCRRT